MIEDATDASFATWHVAFIGFAHMFEHTIVIYLTKNKMLSLFEVTNNSSFRYFTFTVLA